MKKKVLYWSPHINKQVATVKAVFNSAYSLSKYSDNFKPIILNAFGEWDDYTEKFKQLNVTRLAQGIPMGGEVHYLDENTLSTAFQSRKKIT